VEGKIIKELETLMEENREKYEKFFEAFGSQLKFGVYDNFGVNKEKLQDLLIFTSSKDKKKISLAEYVDKMDEKQDSIYYVCGETVDKIDLLPQVETFKDKDLNILYCTDYMDEFVLQTVGTYKDKKMVNIAKENIDLSDDDEKEKLKKKNEDMKDMLDIMKEAIGDISEVRFTNRLKTHPVCLVSSGDITIEMEKVINAMPTDEHINATKVLEINENHKIVDKLSELYKKDKEALKNYSKILYAQARLIEGLPIDNPTELSNLICDELA